MRLLGTVKYLWLYCKSRKLVIKDKHFKDIYNEQLNLVLIKPAYHDESCWEYLTPKDAYLYLKGMSAAFTAVTMKNI